MAKKPWHHAGSRHERGYGSAWVKTRKTIIARDRGLCQPCLRLNRITAFASVDHITPKSRGGTDEHDNLECICTPCHGAKSAREAAGAQGRTLRVRSQYDPSGRVIW